MRRRETPDPVRSCAPGHARASQKKSRVTEATQDAMIRNTLLVQQNNPAGHKL